MPATVRVNPRRFGTSPDGGRHRLPTASRDCGAVVLCSLTTTLGYLALLQSVNAAVRSFGLAAVVGEITCLMAVVVVLPAILASR